RLLPSVPGGASPGMVAETAIPVETRIERAREGDVIQIDALLRESFDNPGIEERLVRWVISPTRSLEDINRHRENRDPKDAQNPTRVKTGNLSPGNERYAWAAPGNTPFTQELVDIFPLHRFSLLWGKKADVVCLRDGHGLFGLVLVKKVPKLLKRSMRRFYR